MVCAVLFLAACGGGGGNSATDQIKAAYTGFFTPKSSLAAHVALVQNGPKFKSVIQGFLGNPLASSVSATVSKVTLQGAAKAQVVYSVKISGFALNNQTGYAVLQGGKWKVADATLCGLLSLDGTGAPAVCKS
jgi:hypothetical protein